MFIYAGRNEKSTRRKKNGRFTQIAKKTRVNLYDSFVVVWWIVVSLEGDNCSQFCDISQVFVKSECLKYSDGAVL